MVCHAPRRCGCASKLYPRGPYGQGKGVSRRRASRSSRSGVQNCSTPSDCTGASLVCGGTCADVRRPTNRNCGTYGQACASGQVCSAGLARMPGRQSWWTAVAGPSTRRRTARYCGASGTCTGASDRGGVPRRRFAAPIAPVSSPGRLVNCGGECMDWRAILRVCGRAARAPGRPREWPADAGEVCSSGSCQVSCAAGSVNCSRAVLVDPQTDHTHCGASSTCTGAFAGTACGSAQVCTAGVCATVACSAGLTQCGSECIDAQTDRDHCGASGTCTGTSAGAVCGSGEICSAGSCQLSCQSGLVNCGGTCVNPQTDRAFCGASGTCTGASAGATCGAGQVCNAGACQASCQANLVNCGGSCVDPQTNPTYCGATGTCTGASAGAVCGSGQICSGGTCQVSCPPGTVYCGGSA